MADISLLIINQYGLLGVLLVTFLSYSIIPFPSEFAVIAVSLFSNPFYVLLAAMIGSTLGASTSYYIGFKGVRKFFPKERSKTMKKIESLVDKYGSLSVLFFSWLPFIGDPLIVFVGSLKMNFWKFLVYSSIARLIYFIFAVWFGIGIKSLF